MDIHKRKIPDRRTRKVDYRALPRHREGNDIALNPGLVIERGEIIHKRRLDDDVPYPANIVFREFRYRFCRSLADNGRLVNHDCKEKQAETYNKAHSTIHC